MVDERVEESISDFMRFADIWPQPRVPDFWRFYANNKDSNRIPYYEAAQGMDVMTPNFNWLDVLTYTCFELRLAIVHDALSVAFVSAKSGIGVPS